MFDSDQERIRQLYSDMLRRQSLEYTFEERFHLIQLNYRLEDLLAGRTGAEPGDYWYCFFVNHKGIRHLRLNGDQIRLADKIKQQQSLNLEEKANAIHLLRQLSV